MGNGKDSFRKNFTHIFKLLTSLDYEKTWIEQKTFEFWIENRGGLFCYLRDRTE